MNTKTAVDASVQSPEADLYQLGGGSSVNMLLYSRPQRSELDAWNMPGWSADEVLKYMNKVCNLSRPSVSIL